MCQNAQKYFLRQNTSRGAFRQYLGLLVELETQWSSDFLKFGLNSGQQKLTEFFDSQNFIAMLI